MVRLMPFWSYILVERPADNTGELRKRHWLPKKITMKSQTGQLSLYDHSDRNGSTATAQLYS
jgi:hypothetical protein